MRFLIFLIVFLYSKEYVVTKYLENRPIINVIKNTPKDVAKIIDMDFKVVDHFAFSKDSNYKFIFNYSNKTLTVKYLENNQTILTKKYSSYSYAYFPFLVHKAIYDINEFFKLPSVKFLTRKVVYSLLIAPKEANIYLSDYTLSYKKLLITGGLNVFPKWADKDQTTIYFTKYRKFPTLYRFNIYTGKLEKVFESEGMLIVSDVKDNKLLLTLAPNGNSDVYEYDLLSRKLKRITKYKGIDVNGKFWGKKIVFISDRYGIPLVFEKEKGLISRVLYQGKNQVGVDAYKDSLVISTRETNKAFGKNVFNLFLINANDDSLKRLTMEGQNMFPNFSVDGSSIMFIKRENFYSKIGIIRLQENKIFYYPLPKILQSFDW